MTNVIFGKDVLFYVWNSTAYVPFICAKDLSINPQYSLVNITTVGDGNSNKYERQSSDYTISISGVNVFTPTVQVGTVMNTFDIWALMVTGNNIRYKIYFRDEENQNIRLVKGTGLIENATISGNYGQPSLSDFSFRGSGQLSIFECDSTFESLTVAVTGDDILVTINGIDGSPTSYKYRIDGFGGETTTTNNPFAVNSLSTGPHQIQVTLICANGKRGESRTQDFYIEVPTPVPPTANAGTDQGITLPTSSVLLSGSGTSPGTITGYSWSKIFGPSTYTIVNPNAQNTNVNGLVAGTYVFMLTVNDSNLQSATDTVTITVDPQPLGSQFTAQWAWEDTDPYASVAAGTFSAWDGSGSFPVGGAIIADFTSAPIQQWWVVQEPTSEPVKTTWSNTVFNGGGIPDSSFRSYVEVSGFRYYVSRLAFDMDPTSTTTFS